MDVGLLDLITLGHGSHDSREDGVCLLEAARLPPPGTTADLVQVGDRRVIARYDAQGVRELQWTFGEPPEERSPLPQWREIVPEPTTSGKLLAFALDRLARLVAALKAAGCDGLQLWVGAGGVLYFEGRKLEATVCYGAVAVARNEGGLVPEASSSSTTVARVQPEETGLARVQPEVHDLEPVTTKGRKRKGAA